MLKAEQRKHEQNKLMTEKRGLPKFDQESIKKLLDGSYHQDLEQDDDVGGLDLNKTLYAKDMDEMQQQMRLEKFEAEFKKIV